MPSRGGDDGQWKVAAFSRFARRADDESGELRETSTDEGSDGGEATLKGRRRGFVERVVVGADMVVSFWSMFKSCSGW